MQITSRQKLTKRIESFIARLECDGRQANRWECDHLLLAMGYLKCGDLGAGEEEMRRAETPEARRSLQDVLSNAMTNRVLTTRELRSNLEPIKRQPLH